MVNIYVICLTVMQNIPLHYEFFDDTIHDLRTGELGNDLIQNEIFQDFFADSGFFAQPSFAAETFVVVFALSVL